MLKLSYILKTLFLCLSLAVVCRGQIQTNPIQPVSAHTLIENVLEKAGLTSSYIPFVHCEADGTQLYGMDKNNTGVAHLEITNGGTAQLTVEIDDKKRSLTYSGTSGVATIEGHSQTEVPPRTVQLSQFLYFPLLELAEAAHDSDSRVSVTGPALIDGRTVYTLTVVGHWPALDPNTTAQGPTVKYVIDTSAMTILSREDEIEDARDKRTRYTRTFLYDDYRPSGSLNLPYKVTEFLQGQTITTTQWKTMAVSF